MTAHNQPPEVSATISLFDRETRSLTQEQQDQLNTLRRQVDAARGTHIVLRFLHRRRSTMPDNEEEMHSAQTNRH